MSSLPRRLRFEILKRDHFACVYCGQGMPAVIVEVDHVLPRADGGTDDPSNLVTACFSATGASPIPARHGAARVTPESVRRCACARSSWRTTAVGRTSSRLSSAPSRARLGRLGRRVRRPVLDRRRGRAALGGGMSRSRRTRPCSSSCGCCQLRRSSTRCGSPAGAGASAATSRSSARAVSRYFAGVCRNKARKADETARRIHITWPELMERAARSGRDPRRGRILRAVPALDLLRGVLWTRGWTVTFEAGSQRVEAPKDRISGLVGPRSVHAHDDVLGSQTALDLAISTIRAVVPPCGQTCACGRPKRPPARRTTRAARRAAR